VPSGIVFDRQVALPCHLFIIVLVFALVADDQECEEDIKMKMIKNYRSSL
jgi:hypothetical protein